MSMTNFICKAKNSSGWACCWVDIHVVLWWGW